MGKPKRGKTATRAAAALTAGGIAFELHSYELPPDPAEHTTLGEAVAEVLGVPAASMFKTLIALVDDAPACAIVPTSGSLSLKKLAAAAGGKRAKMSDPADAEKWTGYVTGGISPIGQTRRIPAYIDSAAAGLNRIYVSAGARGLQLELAPSDLMSITGATAVDGLAV